MKQQHDKLPSDSHTRTQTQEVCTLVASSQKSQLHQPSSSPQLHVLCCCSSLSCLCTNISATTIFTYGQHGEYRECFFTQSFSRRSKIILHSVKGLRINIFRSILTNNILHYLKEIGHHNRIRISNPPSPPTWISVSSKQKTREGPNLEQHFSVNNTSAHRWWGRVHTCTTEDHVRNTMTTAPVVKAQQRLYFLRTLEKNNLAADGLLAVLCWEHIDILHHWMLCNNKKSILGVYSILQITNQSRCIYFTAIKSMLFGWWYNEIVVNDIRHFSSGYSDCKCRHHV